MVGKVKIKNVETYAFENRKIFLDYIQDKHKILVAINAEKVMKNDSRLEKLINNNVGYSDGVGAVMALRQKGFDAVKIPGAEFWLDIIKRFHKEKTFYFIGSTQEVIDITIAKLNKQFPDINIVGYQNGFFDEDGKKALKRLLEEKNPDIVFVAQGSPRQEFLMEELINIHPALYMGLGGSFDVYSGLKKRAPDIFIKLNLEWLYRLFKEPTRIGRQVVLIKFLVHLSLKKL